MQQFHLIEDAPPETVARWMAARLASAALPCAITVPGGSTPFPILEAMVAGDPALWRGVTVWPNDDRIVAEDHPASNTGKLRAMLEPVGARIAALTPAAVPPRFALTWLGMGADGHVASLFPNTDPRADDPLPVRRLTPDPLPAHAPFDRITLTLPALLDTDEIVLTLGGAADKRAVLEAAMRGENDLPIARLCDAVRARGDLAMTVFA